MRSPTLLIVVIGLVAAGITFPLAFYVQRRKGFSGRASAQTASGMAVGMASPAMVFLVALHFGTAVAFTFAAVVVALSLLVRLPSNK